MDPEFWLEKWQLKEIGFNQAEANPLLVKYFKELSLGNGSRVFLPLCGKTIDIPWLLSNGYHIAGIELSKIAVEELFNKLDIKPEITKVGKLKRYTGKNIDIFVGDIFDLGASTLGPVDAIYDRAALVALPKDARKKYTSHLIRITNTAPQFLISFDYDQNAMAGPPFSVEAKEINQHYSNAYHLSCIASVDVDGGLKGVCPAKENVWLLLKIIDNK